MAQPLAGAPALPPNAVVEYIVPVLTYAVATSLVTLVTAEYSDQYFLLLALDLLCFVYAAAGKWLVESLARCNDGVIDAYERVWSYLFELLRLLFVFMVPPLVFLIFGSLMTYGPLPVWYEACALAAPIVALILALLPVMVTSAAVAVAAVPMQ